MRRVIESDTVVVRFLGEVPHGELFWNRAFPILPRDANGEVEGSHTTFVPRWLHFQYEIAGNVSTVLIAKQPLMNDVSWNAIARSGAALGDSSGVMLDGIEYIQDASLSDRSARRYRVRLPMCGRSTFAAYSEWNMLIGAVHTGGIDFSGPSYAWVRHPYDDASLKVGVNGSLSWCQESWKQEGYCVLRGYFHVSRLHAAAPDTRTSRIHWRPVLELVRPYSWRSIAPLLETDSRPERSPNRRVVFYGTIANDALFGPHATLDKLLRIETGELIDNGAPDWLAFTYDGHVTLIAAKPIKKAISWDNIAQVGAATGDRSTVHVFAVGQRRQDAEVVDRLGRRYRVRLPTCGAGTLDAQSEWNQLLGAVHAGDGDFRRNRDSIYGWIDVPFSDEDIHVGERDGAATWCRERKLIGGDWHAVNRGFLTISRYHLTPIGFHGTGFGWRPVLELITDG